MKIRPVLILILASMTLSLAALAADWPCYRGSQYDGVSQEAISDDPLPGGEAKVLWRKELGIGFSAFAIAKGKAYCAGNAGGKDSIFCFDASTRRSSLSALPSRLAQSLRWTVTPLPRVM